MRLGELALLEDTPQGGEKRWVRVGLFLHTDNFEQEHARLVAAGVSFAESPRRESYGTVAVSTDRWGNRWDLLQRDSWSPPGTSSAAAP
jgi:hypothetical protein